MASWMAWETMASPIELSLPALEISSVYNPFSSRFLFLLHFIIAMFTGLMACIPYHPFYHLVTMHVCKKLPFIRIKLFKTIATL